MCTNQSLRLKLLLLGIPEEGAWLTSLRASLFVAAVFSSPATAWSELSLVEPLANLACNE